MTRVIIKKSIKRRRRAGGGELTARQGGQDERELSAASLAHGPWKVIHYLNKNCSWSLEDFRTVLELLVFKLRQQHSSSFVIDDHLHSNAAAASSASVTMGADACTY